MKMAHTLNILSFINRINRINKGFFVLRVTPSIESQLLLKVETDGQKGRRSRSGKRSSLRPPGQHIDAFIYLQAGANCHEFP